MNGRQWPGRLPFLLLLFSSCWVMAAEPDRLAPKGEAGEVLDRQMEADQKAGQQEESSPVRPTVEIVIQGVEGELLENVKAYLGLYKKRKDARLSQLWIQRLHKRATEEIQRALQPFGYYNAVVEATLTKGSEGKWLATYKITPGPRVKISQVDLKWLGEGAEEPALQKALKAFPLKKGSPLDHQLYEKAKTALLDAADFLGYPDAEPKEARVLVDPEKNQARIVLHIDTGIQYHIAEIRLHQDVLDAGFVERYLVDVQPGDVYSQEKLLKIQSELVETGYFSLVDVNPRLNEAKNGYAPVDVTLHPAKRQMYSFGLGYDTDVGINLNARWAHRRINRRGHKADASLRLSPKESYLLGNYWIPIRDPRTTKLGFSLALESENTDTSERNTLDLEAGYYLLWRDWITVIFTQFKHERFVVGEE
ncbi:MAG TPA: hypothetical protein EYP90_08790, partial [Chromatiaceae bacterium]|nr:hypothetical protein [Chromatiaceae bacterium]